MNDAFRRRAEARRATWRGSVARSFSELEAQGLSFWQQASPGARLSAMLQLLSDAWVIDGKAGAAPRFQGSLVGIGRFER
jgi:hypothetical protein